MERLPPVWPTACLPGCCEGEAQLNYLCRGHTCFGGRAFLCIVRDHAVRKIGKIWGDSRALGILLKLLEAAKYSLP